MPTRCRQVADTQTQREPIIMPIIDIFRGGGFQSRPLIDHYLFHYSVHYSRFGFENHLMVILMNSIMGQNNGTLNDPNQGGTKHEKKRPGVDFFRIDSCAWTN